LFWSALWLWLTAGANTTDVGIVHSLLAMTNLCYIVSRLVSL
jgi:hypothetical protein